MWTWRISQKTEQKDRDKKQERKGEKIRETVLEVYHLDHKDPREQRKGGGGNQPNNLKITQNKKRI